MKQKIFKIFREYTGTLYSMLLVLTIISVSGCIQDKVQEKTPDIQKILPEPTEIIPRTAIENVSNELDLLKSKGWDKIASQLGRTKTTTILWYHLKKTYNIDTKMVFGNPNKLNTVIAIPLSSGGNSTIPKVKIKGDDYYIIQPIALAFISEFSYGYIFDDPSSNYLDYNSFRLTTNDIDFLKKWISETGFDLKYKDVTMR
jgi:hypothetical protein